MVDVAHSPTLGSSPAPGGERLAAATTVGDYVIDRFIGAGAMGEVYAGHHPVIGKRVAIKVLRRELAADEEAAKRLTREAQAVNQVDHPNVIDVFAIGRLDDGRLYLVMDLVEGRSLRQVVGDGPLDLAAALELVDPIAGALDAAHARGVVHRDLKPDNVVVSAGTPPKLFVLDFGLAKLVTATSDGLAVPSTLTGQGTWLGTPGYMAPEQWSADGAGPASDRYALGVIAFELLAGELPFSAPSIPAMMEKHFRAPVPALSARGTLAIPSAIDDVLRKAMAKDPAERFPTARAMVDALRAGAGTGVGARAAVAAVDGRRRSWVPAAAGVGVLGFAIVAVIAVRGGEPDHPRPPNDRSGVPEGTVRIDVTSTPDKAEVTRDGALVGTTPVSIYLAPGASANLVVRKPGYLPAEHRVTAGSSSGGFPVTLVEVHQFNGVWQLPDGELRALERSGDQVDIYKLDEVAGERHFYRHFPLVAAKVGVAFASDDEIVDARAPDDPQCHVPVRVEYRYRPEGDALELQREKVGIDLVGGHCVVRTRAVDTSALVRVDASTTTPTEHLAPAGIVKDVVSKSTKASKRVRQTKRAIPVDPALDLKVQEQNKLEAAKANQKVTANMGGQKDPPKLRNQTDTTFNGDSQQVANPPPNNPPQPQAPPLPQMAPQQAPAPAPSDRQQQEPQPVRKKS
jgi:tRNA A-37 threonylcarbamoyl transferase component Bud32